MAKLISAVYCLALGLSEKGEECQVSTFFYCLEENMEDILDTTHISAEKYSKVIEELDNYFKVCKNVIYECMWFKIRTLLFMW